VAELAEAEFLLSSSDSELNYRSACVFWNLAMLYKDSSRPQESLDLLRRYAVAIDAVLEKHPRIASPDRRSTSTDPL
jgi:hypothetical protein